MLPVFQVLIVITGKQINDTKIKHKKKLKIKNKNEIPKISKSQSLCERQNHYPQKNHS